MRAALAWAELAQAAREGRDPRASGALGLHICK